MRQQVSCREKMVIFLVVTLFLFFSTTLSLRCFPPDSLLPARRDCKPTSFKPSFLFSCWLSANLYGLAPSRFQKLTSTITGRAVIAGISWVASRPWENNLRSWGRHLSSTRTSERLPKMFQIEGRQPPNLCAVEVDVDPLDIYEIDAFRLSDLVTAGSAVYWGCLMGQAKIGVEYPGSGEQRRVWAKLLRLEYVPPVVSAARGEVVVRKVGELGNGTRLVVREPVLEDSLSKNDLR